MKKNFKDETNPEDKSHESITDKDSNLQNEELSTEIPKDDNNRPINSEKKFRRTNSNVKIEDYDLIVNSLRDASTSFKDVIFSLSKKSSRN